MKNTQTPFQEILIFISFLILLPPIFYIIVVKGGMYYNMYFIAIGLFMLVFFIIAIFITIGVVHLSQESPLALISINIAVGCLLYYSFMVWEMYPIHPELRYNENTVLNGKIQSYQEQHYLLSGRVQKPKQKRMLERSIIVLFDKRGNAIKDSLIYREDFLERPIISVNNRTYNQANQLIRFNSFYNDHYDYTYNDNGQLAKIKKVALHYPRVFSPWREEETQLYIRDNMDNSLTIETTNLHIDLDEDGDTSMSYQTDQQFFNEQGQILYKGEVKQDEFRYDEKYDYNANNQLISKLEIGYNYKKTNYTYDTAGHLKSIKSIRYEEDSTDFNYINKIEYDTLGYKVHENTIRYYTEKDHIYYPQRKEELFYENEYDTHQNLIRQVVFIKENNQPKRPYYLVVINLSYYE